MTEQAIAGDSDALAALWTQHCPWIAAVILAVHGNSEQLDDTLQDVAVAIARDIGTLDSADSLRPWLRSIARNVAVAAIRRESRQRRLAAHARAAQSNGTVRAAQDNSDAEELAEMMRLISGLPEEYREPLLLRSAHAMPIAVIADILSLTPAAVETRLRRARAMLRDARKPVHVKGTLL